jgi:ech hydrogenase subunit A
LLLVLVLEFGVAHEVEIDHDLYIDQFSVIMALIIGVIGSGICIYALGYMQDFQHHANHQRPQIPGSGTQSVQPKTALPKDRRHIFFSLMFLFLSAMFVIVFANNLTWLLCGWEVTTVCSFALIGYTRTREAISNAFRQIVINLVGGLSFAIALIILADSVNILELNKLIVLGSNQQMLTMVALPILLISLAGFTKAAQAPFQSWLLGAMVAPTPTSALLHSSTMVKAGVFILIKLAPTFGWNNGGIVVVLVGGLTFLFCSGLAISQRNAKRVLAYSTIANLGLIVACAGVGTPEAVWAAIFLLVFHAAAKSLLFLCVGTAEHHIGSRDIEEMDLLFLRMPRLALLMALGILAMFIAPFGMLVSKWATIVSLVDTNNVTLLFILAFGSALTFVFWAKWLGKILAVAGSAINVENDVHKSEWFSLGLMALLSIGCSLGLPWISSLAVEPYLAGVCTELLKGQVVGWQAWSIGGAVGFDNLLIMSAISLLLILVLVFVLVQSGRNSGNADIYLSGVGRDFGNRSFTNSLSGESQAGQRNWYMVNWFGEPTLTPIVNIVCIVVLVCGFILVYGTVALAQMGTGVLS